MERIAEFKRARVEAEIRQMEKDLETCHNLRSQLEAVAQRLCSMNIGVDKFELDVVYNTSLVLLGDDKRLVIAAAEPPQVEAKAQPMVNEAARLLWSIVKHTYILRLLAEWEEPRNIVHRMLP